jgi:3-phenylpropionate/trans-cinnamate dioxygenase ferredoxin component
LKKLVHIASKKDLAPGQIRIHPELHDVIVVCQAPGVFKAVSRNCPHQNWPLDDAYILEDRIVCTLHGSEFDLETGVCLSPPAIDALQTYSIVELDDELYVELDQDDTADSEAETVGFSRR